MILLRPGLHQFLQCIRKAINADSWKREKIRYMIDLYPEEMKSELIRVRLTIEKPSLNLSVLNTKEGTESQ